MAIRIFRKYNTFIIIINIIMITFNTVYSIDCSNCPIGMYLVSSCTSNVDRICSTCTICPRNSYSIRSCTETTDTLCYPCTDCHWGQYEINVCTPTQNRICKTCTLCSSDEFEVSPCSTNKNRICQSCDSCSLNLEQEKLCQFSTKWNRKKMKIYGCPKSNQKYKKLEELLNRAKSNACGAGRCSCSNSGTGNNNPNGFSFPDHPKCTGPAMYNINP